MEAQNEMTCTTNKMADSVKIYHIGCTYTHKSYQLRTIQIRKWQKFQRTVLSLINTRISLTQKHSKEFQIQL